MDFGLSGLLPDITITPLVKWGGGIGVVGFLLLIMVVIAQSGPKILEVPDGTKPDEYYREWKGSKLGARIGKGAIVLGAIALGMFLGGCGVAIVEAI
jgi:hypothetical protein